MKTKIKKVFVYGVCTSFFILICGFSSTKNSDSKLNVLYNYYSDYQVDKTYGGSIVKNKRSAYITLSDPKNITKKGMKFEDLPKGYITIKYGQLNPIREEVFYMGKNQNLNADIYTITTNQQDYDLLYIIKNTQRVGNKNYSFIILLGKADLNDIGSAPLYSTAFYSNTFIKK